MINFNYPSTSSSVCPLLHHRCHQEDRPLSSASFRKPKISFSRSALPPHYSCQWNLIDQLSTSNPLPFLALLEPSLGDDGPVEILPELPAIFSNSDNPTALQLTTSILLTGAISIFLFRSIRRRAKRSVDVVRRSRPNYPSQSDCTLGLMASGFSPLQKFRSSGEGTSLKEEAMERLKEIGSSPIEPKKPTSALQALLGSVSAGIIALILYKFATTVEAGLSRQTLSDDYSIRQITITIRTIVNGLCYLVTFIFGINSVGLLLYSGQLAFNSLFGESKEEDNVDKRQPSSPVVSSENSSSDVELSNKNVKE